jgi:uncharacterized membrane protein YdjX (TVP38/TMEM64 family)
MRRALRTFMPRPRSLDLVVPFIRRNQRLLGVVAFVGVLLAAIDVAGLREQFNLEFIRQVILEHRAGGLFLFILLFALGNLIHIPGVLFMVAAVLTLGQVWGGLVTYVAAVTSCALTYIVIRFLGGDALRLLENRLARRLLRELDARPVAAVALLRFFFQTLPALNYALALSGVRYRDYLLGTLVGLPIPLVVFCFFFDQVVKALHIL